MPTSTDHKIANSEKEKLSHELAAVETILGNLKNEYGKLQSDVEATGRELERLAKEIRETQAEREGHFEEYQTLIEEGKPDEANESLRLVGDVTKRKKMLERKSSTIRANGIEALRRRNDEIRERECNLGLNNILYGLRQRLVAAEGMACSTSQLSTTISGRIDKLTRIKAD